MGRDLGFDETCANELIVHDGRLAGTVRGPARNGGRLVDAAGKARVLQELCARLGCASERALAIGDGANDLEMMALAGLSIAWRAKPVVQRSARFALDHSRLDGVLELFSDRW